MSEIAQLQPASDPAVGLFHDQFSLSPSRKRQIDVNECSMNELDSIDAHDTIKSGTKFNEPDSIVESGRIYRNSQPSSMKNMPLALADSATGPAKRRKIASHEKEEKRLEREAKEQERAELRAKKEEEKKMREEERKKKEEEKKMREEERRKKAEEREEERKKKEEEREEKRKEKEAERQMVEEERRRKERVGCVFCPDVSGKSQSYKFVRYFEFFHGLSRILDIMLICLSVCVGSAKTARIFCKTCRKCIHVTERRRKLGQFQHCQLQTREWC